MKGVYFAIQILRNVKNSAKKHVKFLLVKLLKPLSQVKHLYHEVSFL